MIVIILLFICQTEGREYFTRKNTKKSLNYLLIPSESLFSEKQRRLKSGEWQYPLPYICG
jgi:hypothetical protein